MQSKLLLFLFCLGTIFFSSAQDNSKVEVKGGIKVSNSSDFPWAVQLYNGNDNLICTGVIIGNKWILTAAHCVYQSSQNYSIVAGSAPQKKYSSNYQSVSVARVIVHEGYLKSTNFDDLALLELSTPLVYNVNVQPIEIMDPSLSAVLYKNGTPCVYSGWGIDGRNGNNPADTLQRADMVTIDSAAVFLEQVVELNNHKKTVATTYSIRKNLICGGDSGGPLVYYDANGIPKLVGLLSKIVDYPFPFGCTAGLNVFTYPGYYKNWIDTLIKRDELESYNPLLLDVFLDDTLTTCDGFVAPNIRVYNPGSIFFNNKGATDFLNKLNVKIQLKDQAGTTTESMHLIDLNLGKIPLSFFNNNMDYDLDLGKFGVKFPVVNGTSYSINVELLTLDSLKIQNPLAHPIEKTFFVSPDVNKVFLRYSEPSIRHNSGLIDLEFYHFSSLSKVQKVVNGAVTPFLQRSYAPNDFTTSLVGGTTYYQLEDSFCLTKSCFSLASNLATTYLYQKNSATEDTLYHSRVAKFNPHFKNFCIEELPCHLPRTTGIQTMNFLCKGDTATLSLPGLTNKNAYTYAWFKENRLDTLGTADSLVTTSFETMFVWIQSKSSSSCTSIGYNSARYNQLSLPLLYRKENEFIAVAPDKSYSIAWYCNGSLLFGQKDTVLTPVLHGNYSFRYYSTNANQSDTCWSYYESNVVEYTGPIASTTENQLHSTYPVTVFPNPAGDVLTIASQRSFTNETTIHVYDMNGRLLISKSNLDVRMGNSIALPLHALLPGLYLIKISNESESSSTTFSKY